ncbi:DNA-binding response regulator [Flavobacterium aquidurense]|jgi:two-component system response regulator LytT|uniref:LytR/AlgR family response regulator transcription factor n=1 Tax=Flavobacterium aquidurense TaxID=362413 RepID=UPI000923AD82|nr:LytTR family DNA-binding domain-containing protein [Flavobacterium aquidurense]OXA70814.1 DNA-binding response regulator [Flavobacterium aquidurense]SHF98986.1 two component transcriptional regulator, LytTR family [Flavobacterium frigidimaris]
MKIVIIEDEHLASSYLKSILEQQSIISINEITIVKSVKDAVAFFKINTVDLAFMDIHLGDGKSLDIFEQAPVSCPVIFITAYDSYAVKVFKHFTIDYLLKPYEEDELHEALVKYKNIKETFNTNLIVESLVEIENQSNIQQHFLVNHRDKLLSINDSSITYFYATGKHMFIYTDSGSSYLYNSNLKDLISKLNPLLFFKINRKYIINRNNIQEIIKHSSQKIEILLNVAIPDTEPIILSKKEINNFKNWLDS